MGVVYRAWDWNTNAVVALKVLHAEASGQIERFARETKLLAELNHPTIVQFVGQGQLPDGRPYLAMEWLEGESLSERLERELLTIGEALAMAGQVADALAAAHARGIVHRDLKPGNVFLMERQLERIKLLDFGVASARGTARDLTDTRTILGTPGYMAPEQIQSSKNAGPPADVFALGCVMFKCLTGSVPYEGRNTLDLVVNMMSRPPLSIVSLRNDATRPLEDLMSTMLDRDPTRRPADGAALTALIRQVADSRAREQTDSHRPPSLQAAEDEATRIVKGGG
ncbi:MAG: serine/threonine protein kinase [Deltaproteobacteria bacterium]|nr:serine/threonine protein kinase [Deltaproteobacteria bacterium]